VYSKGSQKSFPAVTLDCFFLFAQVLVFTYKKRIQRCLKVPLNSSVDAVIDLELSWKSLVWWERKWGNNKPVSHCSVSHPNHRLNLSA
jgi:hypothetical protein